jgi:hypothetical protein
MHRTAIAVLASACALAACSPTFDWREVRIEGTGLKAMFPCKPDNAARQVPMAGREVSLQVRGCDTGGATFALLSAEIGDPSRTGEVLAQWNAATLANMRGTATQQGPFLPRGALGLPQSQKVVARGQRQDGSPVQGHAAYFARGRHVFQAVIYTGELKPDVVDAFFAGISFE